MQHQKIGYHLPEGKSNNSRFKLALCSVLHYNTFSLCYCFKAFYFTTTLFQESHQNVVKFYQIWWHSFIWSETNAKKMLKFLISYNAFSRTLWLVESCISASIANFLRINSVYLSNFRISSILLHSYNTVNHKKNQFYVHFVILNQFPLRGGQKRKKKINLSLYNLFQNNNLNQWFITYVPRPTDGLRYNQDKYVLYCISLQNLANKIF